MSRPANHDPSLFNPVTGQVLRDNFRLASGKVLDIDSINSFKKVISIFEDRVDEDSATICTLKDTIAYLEEKHNVLLNTLFDCQRREVDTTRSANKTQMRLTELEGYLRNTTAQLDALKATHKSQLEAHQADRTILGVKAEAALLVVKHVEAEASRAKQENTDVQKRVVHLQQSLDEEANRIKSITKELADTQSRQGFSESERLRLSTELGEALEKLKEAKTKLAAEEATTHKMQVNHTTMQAVIHSLKESNAQKDERLLETLQELKSLKAQITAGRQEFLEAVGHTKAEAMDIQADAANYQNELAAAHHEISTVKAVLENSETLLKQAIDTKSKTNTTQGALSTVKADSKVSVPTLGEAAFLKARAAPQSQALRALVLCQAKPSGTERTSESDYNTSSSTPSKSHVSWADIEESEEEKENETPASTSVLPPTPTVPPKARRNPRRRRTRRKSTQSTESAVATSEVSSSK